MVCFTCVTRVFLVVQLFRSVLHFSKEGGVKCTRDIMPYSSQRMNVANIVWLAQDWSRDQHLSIGLHRLESDSTHKTPLRCRVSFGKEFAHYTLVVLCKVGTGLLVK